MKETSMRAPAIRIYSPGIIADNFAGGGGTSLGIEWALGRSPDVAVNHNQKALAVHALNHPATRHFCEDVFDVDPRKAAAGKDVALAWFSPDCTWFSKARGSQPFRDRHRARRIRGLAGVAIRWAAAVRPRVIILENVEEFLSWGPIGPDNRPDPARRGHSFNRWLGKLRAQGYAVEWRLLRACDFGAPTTRRRLFIIARSDGRPIVWPEATHGPGRAYPYRTAAECIQWDRPCPSIFERKKPYAENTLRRIARGIQRFVIDAPEPFLVPTTHGGDARVHAIGEPMRTITAAHRGEFALVSPSLVQTGWGERKGQTPRTLDIRAPMGTIVAQGMKQALVAAYMAKHYGDPARSSGGGAVIGQQMSLPIGTVTTRDHHSVVATSLLKFYGTCTGQPMGVPLPTVTATGGHLAEVRAFLTQYNGQSVGQAAQLPLNTVTTKDRFGVVMVRGEPHAIADIGMRMLAPRELYRGQSFPDSYVIDVDVDGESLTLEEQVFMCGNAVPPELARAIVEANVERREVAAA